MGYIDTSQTNANISSSTYNWYGINRTRRGTKGEFAEMLNMSTDEYPCIAPRKPRTKILTAPGNIQALAAPEESNVNEITEFTGIAGDKYYYNGAEKGTLPSGYKWEIVRMYNLHIINGCRNENGVYQSVMYSYNIITDKWEKAGTVMDNLIVTSGTDETGDYLATCQRSYNTEVYNHTVTDKNGNVIYNSEFFDKYQSTTTSKNIFEARYEVGDEVLISGFPARGDSTTQYWQHYGTDILTQPAYDCSENNTCDTDLYPAIDDIDRYTITSSTIKGFDVKTTSHNGVTYYIHYIYLDLLNKDGETVHYADMSGSDTSNVTYCTGVQISGRIRQLEHIAVHDGRLWGTIGASNKVYAASADERFDFSDRSIRIGYGALIQLDDTPGRITGLVEYEDQMIIFKRNSIKIVYGDDPTTYSIKNIMGIGCIDAKSIAVTPSGVIFLYYDGYYTYSGSVPSRISRRLNTRYTSAVSAYSDGIYYTSATAQDGTQELLLYDLSHSTWHKHDGFKATGFFKFADVLYMADTTDIYKLNDDDGTERVEWSITSTRTHDNTLNKKNVNMMWIRCESDDDAEFTIEMKYDNGDWVRYKEFKGVSGYKVLYCPIRPVPGYSYFYRISGKGKIIFYEIELTRDIGGRDYSDENGIELTLSQPEPTQTEDRFAYWI